MLDLGKISTIKALGGEWKVGPFTIDTLEAFRDWIAEQEGDPFAELENKWFDLLPKEEQVKRIAEAENIKRQLKRFTLQCSIAKEWMANERGAVHFLTLLLKPNHPNITREQVFRIAQEAGPALKRAVETAIGRPPGNASTPGAAMS